MRTISKKIVTDDRNNPIAVQIDYADWLRIERELADLDRNGSNGGNAKLTNLNDLRGSLKLTEDPLEYQKRIRAEWP